MRAITVRQPWSWALIHGGKDVENRVRNIAGDYRGPVAIHAGLADADNAPDSLWLSAMNDIDSTVLREPGRSLARWQPRGVIIGVVNLWAVHRSRVDSDLAEEIEAHLAPQVDLFGDLTTERRGEVRMSTTRETTADWIVSRCGTCEASRKVRNSGLNRAGIAAWETRHQHLERTTTDPSTLAGTAAEGMPSEREA